MMNNFSPQHTALSAGLATAQEQKLSMSRPLQSTGQLRARPNVFLNLPIAGRLTLGFVVAALVAALASGVVGLQRAQSLSRQTDFYHSLLQYHTSLTTGRDFLELMDSKLHQTLEDASAPNPSQETILTGENADIPALNTLAVLYGQTLNGYAQNDLLSQHVDQQALLDESGDESLAVQQATLTNSAQRTWQVYLASQQAIVNELSHWPISANALTSAELMVQQQGEPTNADAQSALHSLIQLNERMASDVDSATSVEIHNQLLTTLLAIFCAFIVIALMGWFLSETLVRRLHQLHRVTRAVEEGRIHERVLITGRDEIADVSLAVNAMVDTIVGLLEETRKQRDALAGAAEHLFSDMRIVNAGDLRVSAPVGDDPIGVLANAFNFTVGRFRRFLLRTQTAVEQLEVISHQGLERSQMFTSLVRTQMHDPLPPQTAPTFAKNAAFQASNTASLRPGQAKTTSVSAQHALLTKQLQETQEMLCQATRDDLQKRLNATRETLEKTSLSLGRLSKLISARSETPADAGTEKKGQAQIQEVMALEQLISRLTWEIRQVQFNAADNFTRLDTAFTNLVRLATARSQSVVAEISASQSALSDAHYQEFVRQAGSFAVDINALMKRLSVMIQEMRASITPFRLDGVAVMSESVRSAPHQHPTELVLGTTEKRSSN